MDGISSIDLVGHEHYISAVAINDNEALTGSSDGTVRIWDVKSGRCVRELVGHRGLIKVLGSNGNRVVTGSIDDTVKIWDKESGNCLYTCEGFSGVPNAMLLSDKKLIIGCHDGSVRVYDINSCDCLRVFSGHTAPVYAVAASDDIIATGSIDGNIKFWRMDRDQPLNSLFCYDHSIEAIAITKDKIVAGLEDGTARIWDISFPDALYYALANRHDFHIEMIWAIGNNVITESVDALQTWDINTGKSTHAYGRCSAVAVSDNKIFTGQGLLVNDSIKVWDFKGVQCLDIPTGHMAIAEIAACGNKIITGSVDGKATIWIDHRPRQIMRVLATALHPSCGLNSPVSALPRHLVEDIANLAVRPWEPALPAPGPVPAPAAHHGNRDRWCTIC